MFHRLFMSVVSAAALGILLSSNAVSAAPPGPPTPTTPQTTLQVRNNTNGFITVFITLSGYGSDNPGFLQDVSQINWVATPASPPTPITGSGLQGSFPLSPGQTVSYSTAPGTAISGNMSVLAAPVSCPTQDLPDGMNLAEFTLNVNTAPYGTFGDSQEAVDISCVNGVNCKWRCQLRGGPSWNTGVKGYKNIKNFSNKPLGTQSTTNKNNFNRVGVYPPGCDDCTASVNPGCNQVWLDWGLNNTLAICNPQRADYQSGGIVRFCIDKLYGLVPL